MIFEADSSVLVLFCRRPAFGSGKKRIAATLGMQKALELSRLLIDTMLEDAAAWPGSVVFAPASATDREWAKSLLPDATILPQPRGNLGVRISHIDSQIRMAGGKRIIFIGSDSPALTSQILIEAAEQLETSDFVMVPARDGGVTLMGAAVPWPDLGELAWGTANLFTELKQRCNDEGSRVSLFPTGFDIDTQADLIDTPTLLKDEDRPARLRLCEWIESLDLPNSGRKSGLRTSVIIPVLNDKESLEKLLARVSALNPAADEIIVVEGTIQGECATLSRSYGAAHFTTEANRGAQLRKGAQEANGEVVWFLHADSLPPFDAVAHINAHLEAGSCGGYFRFRFGGPRNWRKTLLETAINWRTRVGVPYGDQGLFVTRDAYLNAGGHKAIPLFEDVSLVKSLRRRCGCKEIASSITVSPRRWERDGWLRRSLHNRWLAFLYAIGIAPEVLARQYGYTIENKNNMDNP